MYGVSDDGSVVVGKLKVIVLEKSLKVFCWMLVGGMVNIFGVLNNMLVVNGVSVDGLIIVGFYFIVGGVIVFSFLNGVRIDLMFVGK